jgi:hypothetical protein
MSRNPSHPVTVVLQKVVEGLQEAIATLQHQSSDERPLTVDITPSQEMHRNYQWCITNFVFLGFANKFLHGLDVYASVDDKREIDAGQQEE